MLRHASQALDKGLDPHILCTVQGWTIDVIKKTHVNFYILMVVKLLYSNIQDEIKTNI